MIVMWRGFGIKTVAADVVVVVVVYIKATFLTRVIYAGRDRKF